MIKMILAMDLAGGIGKNGTLPWHKPEDLVLFKAKTYNSIVVMGRNTWNDPKLPKPLKNRHTIVVGSKANVKNADVADEVWDNLSTAVLAHQLKLLGKHKPVWIIGGAGLYNELVEIADEVHISIVSGHYDCDTFFDRMDYVYDNFCIKSETGIAEDCSCYVYSR